MLKVIYLVSREAINRIRAWAGWLQSVLTKIMQNSNNPNPLKNDYKVYFINDCNVRLTLVYNQVLTQLDGVIVFFYPRQ